MRTCLLSPSGQRAEHEVARSWPERSRPRGHRPSGQEHERARFNVKRRLGANPRTGFVEVSLTQWLDAGAKLRRWYCVGSGRRYVGAKHVVRGDPLRPRLVPPGLEETDHSCERVQVSRQGSAESVGRTTKGETTEQQHDGLVHCETRAERPVDRSGSSRTKRSGGHLPSGTDRVVRRTSVRSVEKISGRAVRGESDHAAMKTPRGAN